MKKIYKPWKFEQKNSDIFLSNIVEAFGETHNFKEAWKTAQLISDHNKTNAIVLLAIQSKAAKIKKDYNYRWLIKKSLEECKKEDAILSRHRQISFLISSLLEMDESEWAREIILNEKNNDDFLYLFIADSCRLKKNILDLLPMAQLIKESWVRDNALLNIAVEFVAGGDIKTASEVIAMVEDNHKRTYSLSNIKQLPEDFAYRQENTEFVYVTKLIHKNKFKKLMEYYEEPDCIDKAESICEYIIDSLPMDSTKALKVISRLTKELDVFSYTHYELLLSRFMIALSRWNKKKKASEYLAQMACFFVDIPELFYKALGALAMILIRQKKIDSIPLQQENPIKIDYRALYRLVASKIDNSNISAKPFYSNSCKTTVSSDMPKYRGTLLDLVEKDIYYC